MQLPSSLILVVTLVFLTSCGKEKESGNNQFPDGSAGWPATVTTDGGGFEVTINPEGGAIERNKHFAVDVTLSAKSGDLGGAGVTMDADMPAHRHGMNTKPEVSAVGDGRFRVEGMLFHMGGDWVITVTVARGGKTESASFPVSIE